VELEVTPVVEFGPLEFEVRGDEVLACVDGRSEGDVLAVGGGGGYGWIVDGVSRGDGWVGGCGRRVEREDV
jgi:hypothetical protein